MSLRIGTRGSKLALAQSEWVKAKIESEHPRIRVELVKIKTKGDRILDSPLSKIGGKGLFVKEIEDALLKSTVDLAVHSMKDVPAIIPEGLEIAVFPKREDPRDAFVSLKYKAIKQLPEGARVGTSSLRRGAQVLHLRPDLRVIQMRGNVDTRIGKLDSGYVQALILASAGLMRLGLSKRISSVLSPKEFLPAVGQGVLGVELRRKDRRVKNLVEFLNDKESEITARAERAFLEKLGGGCQVPLAALARLKDDTIHIEGMVAEVDGSLILRKKIRGSREKPEEAGRCLAEDLLSAGADRILARVYSETS
ncbi:MAG: hydroxymethylbilane synthase [Deltaproteobacteria bacterium]|nr:hydroxymethylbilane synthase [Deltaproteobacteria bacterium]